MTSDPYTTVSVYLLEMRWSKLLNILMKMCSRKVVTCYYSGEILQFPPPHALDHGRVTSEVRLLQRPNELKSMKVLSNHKALCRYYSFNNSNIVTICCAPVKVQEWCKVLYLCYWLLTTQKRVFPVFQERKLRLWHNIVR